jgi:hypothetical protein
MIAGGKGVPRLNPVWIVRKLLSPFTKAKFACCPWLYEACESSKSEPRLNSERQNRRDLLYALFICY